MLDFHDKLKRSYLCEEQWFTHAITWTLWYEEFNEWVRDGKCPVLKGGLRNFQKVMDEYALTVINPGHISDDLPMEQESVDLPLELTFPSIVGTRASLTKTGILCVVA